MKRYEKPIMAINRFNSESVITASDGRDLTSVQNAQKNSTLLQSIYDGNNFMLTF